MLSCVEEISYTDYFSECWLFDKRGDFLYSKTFFQLSTTVLFVSESSVTFNELCSMGAWRKVTRCLFRHRGEAEVLHQPLRNLGARMERSSAIPRRLLYTFSIHFAVEWVSFRVGVDRH